MQQLARAVSRNIPSNIGKRTLAAATYVYVDVSMMAGLCGSLYGAFVASPGAGMVMGPIVGIYTAAIWPWLVYQKVRYGRPIIPVPSDDD